MDLMTLAAKITLDDKQFTQGVGKAEKMGQQLANKMSAMTVAAGNIMADVVRKGASAISDVITGAIDGYADYQQLIGGVETLFKTSADKVAGYAKKSYKTTGLSANQYMETVTSFSASMLQGLQGDTDKAADMANMAVTDMADNANKMGTDIGSIQNAYQGFAKQNFTMLDNLKLGYGGTREEMVRLVNESGILDHKIKDLDGITFDQLVQAIHEIQKQMGITGTTASEAAETISGSKASLAAAWQDLLSAVGGEGDQTRLDETMESFKTSFSGYMENFIPTLVTTISNSGSLVTAIAEAIGDLPTDLLSKVADAGVGAGTEMVGGISKITSWLIDSITNMFKSASANPQEIAEFGKAIGDFLGTAISDIVTNAPDILKGIVDVGVNLAGGLVEGLFKGLFGEGTQVEEVMDQMTETIEDAESKATKSSAIVSYLKSLVNTYGDAATKTTQWQEAVADLQNIVPETKEIFESAGNNVEFLIGPLDNMIAKMREAAIQAGLMKALKDAYSLLGEQNTELHYQQRRYARNEFQQGEYMDNIRQGIMDSYASLAKEYWDVNHDESGNLLSGADFDQNYYNEMQNLAEGLVWMGDSFGSLKDLDFEGLKTFISELSDPELTKLFDRNKELYDKAGIEMQDAQTKIDAAAKEIEATNLFITDMESAAQAAATNLGTSFDTTAAGIESGGSEVAAALGAAAAGIAAAGVILPGGISAGGDWKAGKGSSIQPHGYQLYMPEATGLDYVPYTGFRAELHRGETILTKAEADRYRNGSGTAEVVGAIQGMRGDLQNMQLVVGREAFGRAVVGNSGGRMNNYIGQAESRHASGYGT